jgi:hypothetical protein
VASPISGLSKLWKFGLQVYWTFFERIFQWNEHQSFHLMSKLMETMQNPANRKHKMPWISNFILLDLLNRLFCFNFTYFAWNGTFVEMDKGILSFHKWLKVFSLKNPFWKGWNIKNLPQYLYIQHEILVLPVLPP